MSTGGPSQVVKSTNVMGRWMSPDRLNLTDDRVLNPTNTLNKYAYGANNPLKYVDPDGKDITVFYTGPSIVPIGMGHIMFVAENQETGDAALMSFGPVRSGWSDAEHTLFGDFMMVTNSFDKNMTADQLRSTYSSLTIQTTPEEAQEVIDLIRSNPAYEHQFTLYHENCTTTCREALKIINKLTSNNKDWTPMELWKTLFAQYASPWWKNNFGYWRNQPGINYGKQTWEYYNEFDLLDLLLHGDDSSVDLPPENSTSLNWSSLVI